MLNDENDSALLDSLATALLADYGEDGDAAARGLTTIYDFTVAMTNKSSGPYAAITMLGVMTVVLDKLDKMDADARSQAEKCYGKNTLCLLMSVLHLESPQMMARVIDHGVASPKLPPELRGFFNKIRNDMSKREGK
jgi:hypothetical protein